MKTYTICGSMRFEKEMQRIAYELETGKGYNILQCVYSDKDGIPTREELLRLEDAHYRKIDLSDGIYVVNIDDYIGTSVKKEIEYAKKQGKEVLYHCEK
ncbi:MAG: hypothetical protein IJC91_02885 [Oscillospiraceae bacterium]|nr:hypothetical protein [Oscillospiraceae bacterium]